MIRFKCGVLFFIGIKKGLKMKFTLKLSVFIVIFASTSLLQGKPGDESDVKHPYHPIVQDAKLIASYAKIWWITEKMKKHASGDADQQNILNDVQDNAHEMKEMLIKALTKRVMSQAKELESVPTETVEEAILGE